MRVVLFFIIDPNTGKTFLCSMVVLTTGSPIIDPTDDFQIIFHDKKERWLLEADAYFNSLILSTASNTYEEFKKTFMICLSAGAQGFKRF